MDIDVDVDANIEDAGIGGGLIGSDTIPIVVCRHSIGKVLYQFSKLRSTICAIPNICFASLSLSTEYMVVVNKFARARNVGRSIHMSVSLLATFSSSNSPLPIHPFVPGKSSMGLDRWTHEVIIIVRTARKMECDMGLVNCAVPRSLVRATAPSTWLPQAVMESSVDIIVCRKLSVMVGHSWVEIV